jgi:hypothetical protein
MYIYMAALDGWILRIEYRMEFGVGCIKLEHLRISLQHKGGTPGWRYQSMKKFLVKSVMS